jgi:hypothetical protein
VTTVSDPAAALTADGLLRMSAVQLDALFQNAPAGEVPTGRGKGTIVMFPGSPFAKAVSWILGRIFWQGKYFRPSTNDLQNLILPTGVHAIRAEVYTEDSWLDDRPCIVLDYSKSSKVAGWIRDEIREVSPGLYLGIVWGVGRVFGRHKLILRFALTIPPGP